MGLLILVVVLSGCTQEPVSTAQTCTDIGGYVCGAGESCFGAKLNAFDTDPSALAICCGTPCSISNDDKSGEPLPESPPAEPTPPAEDKSLEELNLKLIDFPEGFKVDGLETGYIKNALDYHDGNAESAKELIDNGWMENHMIVVKKEGEEEILGQKVILVRYQTSISKYNKNSSYKEHFANSIKENKEGFEKDIERKEEIALEDLKDYPSYELRDISLLALNIGDQSTCKKVLMYNTYLDTLVPIYYCYFTVDNYYVNYWAEGKGRNISDEDVVKYAKIIEQRIEAN